MVLNVIEHIAVRTPNKYIKLDVTFDILPVDTKVSVFILV